MKTLLNLTLCMLFLFGCSSDSEADPMMPGTDDEIISDELYFPPINAVSWETRSPEALQWNTEEETRLFDFLEENDTRAFIILKDGRMVVERYFGQHTQNTNWFWASAGKTLTAFTIGIAQEEGFLEIEDRSADYLGEGWTSLETDQENLITIRNQLTMTSGMSGFPFDCLTPDCLTYVADAGTRWAYHNGPYTLLQTVVANATEQEWSAYFNEKLRDRIGMDGFWLSTNNLNNVYFSTARSMARFGLLNLANGQWNGDTIFSDTDYQNEMRSTSQDLNKAYGYLWWLNGKESYRLPAPPQQEFTGSLIPNAPADLYAGLGASDQKLYLVPSQGLVIVRMGEDAGEDTAGLSSFDNQLWAILSDYIN